MRERTVDQRKSLMDHGRRTPSWVVGGEEILLELAVVFWKEGLNEDA